MRRTRKLSERLQKHIDVISNMVEASKEDLKRTLVADSAMQGAVVGGASGALYGAGAAGKLGAKLGGVGGALAGAAVGAGGAALAWLLLNAEADLYKWIGQKIRKDGKDKTIQAVRQAAYKAQDNPKFNQTQKLKIKANANKVVDKLKDKK